MAAPVRGGRNGRATDNARFAGAVPGGSVTKWRKLWLFFDVVQNFVMCVSRLVSLDGWAGRDHKLAGRNFLEWIRPQLLRSPVTAAPSVASRLDRLQPYVLSILRIVAGLLFLEHGMSRLFGFPSPLPTPPAMTMYWFAGCIEFAGGILALLGLFTRPAAFIMSGEMAFAYFISHAPRGFFPILNNADGAVLYCFVFL